MALSQRYIEKSLYTEDEYLGFEAEMPYKSEYVYGEIRAMSGGSDDHATISVSVGAELRASLKGRGCRVMSSDMKIWTPLNTFRYPDATVVCGPRHYYNRSRSVITNPLAVIEVLSDSTTAADYGEKRIEYQTVESLQHYLLVSQWEPRVEVYTRKDDGHWDYVAVEGTQSSLQLSALGVAIALADIYDGIEFDQEKE